MTGLSSFANPQPYRVAGSSLELLFHPGQWRAWDSDARIIVVLAGTQGGKTSFGPHWLYREIQQCGPGDYIVVTPTYPLLSKKALPEFLRVFQTLLGLGDYHKAEKIFQFDAVGEIRTWGAEQDLETRIMFGHAQDPESLESATAKAAWLDEAGQNKFRLSSFEAIMRRLSLAQGRILITTTPYNLGWLKQQLYDQREHRDDIDVIRFDSTENPAFPAAEMERAKRDLPLWKFNMFYRAIFTRPAGMIYDCFDEAQHVVAPFDIPHDWTITCGQDYGGANTAMVFLAQPPRDRRWFLFREYHAGGRTAAQHKTAVLADNPLPKTTAGGAASEQQWRDEFTAAGWYVQRPPIADVEVGISRVYGAIKRGELFVFDTCAGVRDEIMSYSRELDDAGNPTAKIADKNDFHLLDALRYIGSTLWGDGVQQSLPAAQPEQPSRWNVGGGQRWGKHGNKTRPARQ